MSLCPTCKASFQGGEQFCPRDGTPLRSSLPEDPLAGRVLSGRYRLQEVIGRGGMGAVYRAHHILMDKAVAVKVLRSELASDTEAVARFHREARSASRLDHEHIIRVTDFGQTDDGLLFLVMELLDGENLAQVLGRGALPWRRAAVIAREIGLGLSHAHEQGVIHRDLKPENIVLVRRGKASRQVVKVLDFGLAKLVHGQAKKNADADKDVDEPDVAVQSLTRTGVVFGTPEYMSPEQAEGRSLDARADLYALGVVFYQMVTGRLPFSAPTFLALIAKTVHEPPPPFQRSQALADVPVELESLILDCLAKHPDERPQSADELVDALEQIVAAHPGDGERSSERRLPVRAPLVAPGSGAPSPKQIAPPAAETLRPAGEAGKDRAPEGAGWELPLAAPEPAASSDPQPPGGVARTVPRALPRGRTPKTVLAGAEPESHPPPSGEPISPIVASDRAVPAESLADAYSRALRSGAGKRESGTDEPRPEDSDPRGSGRHPAKSSSKEHRVRAAGASSDDSRPKRSGPHPARSGSALRIDGGPASTPSTGAAATEKSDGKADVETALPTRPDPAEELRRPVSEEALERASDEAGDEPLRVPRRPYWLFVAAFIVILGGISYVAAPRAFYRPPPAGPTVSESLRRARLLLESDPLTPARVEEALRALATERATNNSPEVHRLLGRAYEAQNNRLRALGHLYTAARLGRGTSEESVTELRLSQLLSRLGHKPEACQSALRALETRPPPGPDVRAPAEAIVSVLHCKK